MGLFNFDQTSRTADARLHFVIMAAFAQRQVLVVDDNPAIRACITTMLESAGYDVAEAEDGLEALLLISKSTPDVVVSDLNMPRMSGFDLLPEVHRRFPQIVTIAMSGAYRNANEVPPEVMAHGFYAKGAPPRSLIGTLAQLLDAGPARSA
jgi:CheY-like chemotaxis protein